LQGCANDVDTRSQRAALAEMANEFAGFDYNDEDSDESVVIQVIIISKACVIVLSNGFLI